MLIRTALALLLLLPAAASAQDLDKAVSALVRISGTKDGTPVRGSGFVVSLDGDKAAIVTASHVIEGVQQFEVTFGVDPTQSFLAGRVLGIDTGNPRGLAVFQVSGGLPAGVTTLSFETKDQIQLGEDVYLLGYPYMAVKPLTLRLNFSGQDGNFLQLAPAAGDGGSGAPVLRQGKVLGVVVDESPQLSFAVKALVVRDALNGWGIKLGEQSVQVPPAAQTKSAAPTEELGGQRSTTATNNGQPLEHPAPPKYLTAPKPFTEEERQKMQQASQLLSTEHGTKLRGAFQMARDVADAHPESREAQHLVAEAAYRLSRWNDAVTYFRRGGDLKDDEPEDLFYMAVALYESGDKPAAAAALRRCLPNLQRSPYVEAYIRKIMELGSANVSWLGIQYQDLNSGLRATYGVPEGTSGVVVTDVTPKSKAYEGGLRPGNVISEFNGLPVKSMAELEKSLTAAKSKSYLRFYVLGFRLGKEVPFFVVVQVP